MFELDFSGDERYDSYGTIDIETSGFEGDSEDLIAIGMGYYEAGADDAEVKTFTRKNVTGDEQMLIQNAYEWYNSHDPDALVSFGGDFFDLTFLSDKIEALGYADCPDLAGVENHVDMFELRKPIADRNGKKWPSLEESIAEYGIPELETEWEGSKLVNTRFGEELAPKYMDALRQGDTDTLDALEATVLEYTESDIEANIALYESDAGREYTPTYAR